MATYLIGDLHGCFIELQHLLEQIDFNIQKDKLWFTGDLVARGDDSLSCLRFVKNLGDKATVVLGNHDLHLLSTAFNIKKVKPQDNVDAILNAPDRQALLEWLSHRPLLAQHPQYGFLLTHAGISPDWDLTTTINCAREVESQLQSKKLPYLLEQMYENQPDKWSNNLTEMERWRYIINTFTRMRFCYADKRLDFMCKLPASQAPNGLKPWFELANPLYHQQEIIFGHWASLVGYATPENIYALDTGCVWGGHLTLLRWEDKKIFTQHRLTIDK